jgi:hypothetical protein
MRGGRGLELGRELVVFGEVKVVGVGVGMAKGVRSRGVVSVFNLAGAPGVCDVLC